MFGKNSIACRSIRRGRRRSMMVAAAASLAATMILMTSPASAMARQSDDSNSASLGQLRSANERQTSRSIGQDSPFESNQSLNVTPGTSRAATPDSASRGSSPKPDDQWIPPYQAIFNRATAWNFQSRTTKIDSSVKLTIARGAQVDLYNSATTLASCNDCRAMAVGVLAVVVPSDKHRVNSIHNVNRATALRCNNCTLINVLHTIVVETPGTPDLSGSERRQLEEIERRIRSLPRYLSNDELVSQTESLINEYENVLVNAVR